MSHHMVVLGTWRSVWDAVELVVGLLNTTEAAVQQDVVLGAFLVRSKDAPIIKATLHVVARSP
jgi:hypothetical protein